MVNGLKENPQYALTQMIKLPGGGVHDAQPLAQRFRILQADDCGSPAAMQQVAHITMPDLDFDEIVGLICLEDPRFDRRAYQFTREGLDHAVKVLKKSDTTRAGRSLHVSGPELLEGLRAFAIDQFGPLAITVLNSWGIRKCADFGDIVFSLIEYSVFSKTDTDRREDFSEIFDFEEAFVKPFLPKQPRPVGWSQAVLESV